MLIEDIEAVAIESAFFRDDQRAIREGSPQPLTPGFAAVREPGHALALLLYLSDGHVVSGDCAEVQYAGAAGREAPLDVAVGSAVVESVLRPALVGRPAREFRSHALPELPAWLRYGASQALLRAAAHARVQPMAAVICEDWSLPFPTAAVPIFAQSGDAVSDAVDRMIRKRVDALPHGLVNNVATRVGRDGEILLALVRSVRDRILELGDAGYRPTLHFDTYGTIGLAFPELDDVASYLTTLEEAARPFALRIEHPVDAGGREPQIARLGALRSRLRERGSTVEIVADEWCNTVADVEAFAAAGCVDMIQVKTPDLGGLDETVDALLACRRHGVKAYCGGTCNETVGSAQATAHVALACAADLAVAKPGMGVDEGLSVMRNEMAVALARLRRLTG